MDGDGPSGGASRSLFESVVMLKKLGCSPYFIAVKGTALKLYKKTSKSLITTWGLAKFNFSYYNPYKKLRWLILIREICFVPASIIAILKAKKIWKNIQIIHANEIHLILTAILAKIVFKKPLVLHVRSLVGQDKKRNLLLKFLICRFVDAVVAIDLNVKRTLQINKKIEVIHNSFSAKPKRCYKKNIQESILNLGFVGNLHANKGFLDICKAAKVLAGENIEFKILVAGGTTRNIQSPLSFLLSKIKIEQNIKNEAKCFIKENKLRKYFKFYGFVFNLQKFYNQIDVLLFPSHLDAPGRPVFEAAFFGVPSIVCISRPMSDTFIPMKTGLTIPEMRPNKLAKAIKYFYHKRSEIIRMGQNARQLAWKNFDSTKNGIKLFRLYQKIILINNQNLFKIKIAN